MPLPVLAQSLPENGRDARGKQHRQSAAADCATAKKKLRQKHLAKKTVRN
jgi:hypothetical protein